jgi:predicted phage terminase large subunit-like protein
MPINIDKVRNDYETLKPRIEKLTERYRNGELDGYETDTFLSALKMFRKYERIVKSSESVLYFAYEYFSVDKNPDYANCLIPSGVKITDAPDVHHELCDLLDDVTHVTKNKRVVWGMPRGHMKTGFMSNIYPVHACVFDTRKYILVLSESEGMAQRFIEFIKDALKFNTKLREDFGECLSPNKNMNDIDNNEMFRTMSGTLVHAGSTQKQLRGARNGAYRPDLVLCDDLESSKNTNTFELRQKNLEWFNKTIIPIGTPENMAIIYMGTTVHKSGLLTEVYNRSDFEGKIYSALVNPPERLDLWEQFEDIYRNQENDNRKEDAEAFYNEHKELMDEGVKTLWEKRFSYKLLMMEKVNMGSKAFSSEFLNNPIDDETAVFKESLFVHFDDKDLFDSNGKPLPLDYYGFWDIAVGKSTQKGDYNAIVIVGRDRRTGICYTVDTFAQRIPMHKALEVAVEKIRQYKPKVFGVETVQAQYDMYRQLQERCTKQGLYFTKIKAINPRGKKEDRIETLEPMFESGSLRIKNHQRLLKEQLIEFPSGDHDDLPDALAQCIDICGGVRRRRTYYQKPEGL